MQQKGNRKKPKIDVLITIKSIIFSFNLFLNITITIIIVRAIFYT